MNGAEEPNATSTVASEGDSGEVTWTLELAFERCLEEVTAAEEFDRFRDHEAEARVALVARRSEILAQVSTWMTQQEPARLTAASKVLEESRSYRLWKIATRSGIAIFGTALVISSVILMVIAKSTSSTRSDIGLWNFVVFISFVLLVASSIVAWDAPSGLKEAQNELDAFDAKVQAEADEQLRSRLTEGFAIALSNELTTRGVLRFPTSAPRLVELADDATIRSRSIDRVQRFVLSHETSAVGIAGPRGVGKTTLLRAVARRVRERGGLAVVIPAPVEYSATDLLRSIAFAVNAEGTRDRRASASTGRLRRRRLGLILILLGLVFLLGASFPKAVADSLAFVASIWPLLLGGGTLVCGALLIIQSQWWPAWTLHADSATGHLEELVRNLEYEMTRSGGIAAKGWALGEITMTRSLSRRPLAQGDIVKLLREALQDLTVDGARTVFIAIDELDKLPSHEAAVRMINILKDLVRIPGVHILVTISDEARASLAVGSFERDAFDSTFDTVFEVERLSVVDSKRLIDARAVGFALQLLAFCHVCSAGLARDLIREARALIDRAAEAESVPPWTDLARSSILAKAQTGLSSYTRVAGELSEVPLWVAKIETLRELDGDALRSVRVPDGVGDVLASVFAQTTIALIVVEWLRGFKGDDVNEFGPTVEQLRDAVLLASRRGGAATALETVSGLHLPKFM